MRKSREVDTIFLTLQFFCVLAFFAVVYLKSFVVLCHEAELAGVVEVERGNMVRSLAGGGSEAL